MRGSIIDMLTTGDQLRRDTFKQIKMFPKLRLIQIDVNYRGTVERALQCSSFKSLKLLLDYFFENVNTQEYYNLLMHDLSIVLDQK